ncbi:acylphosphate phosphohydrolase, putative [Lachnospiraceae bacterium KM106-2]|nr:acylphosphate phosphohydrolase, putative [Lachnospiraceae bacterium KM106-2]
MVRKHIFFSGRVQGVGFRYRSYYLAESLGLTGWVRNCYDERVEMEVQGKEAVIYEFIERMKKQHFIRIDEVEMSEIPREEEVSFCIRD